MSTHIVQTPLTMETEVCNLTIDDNGSINIISSLEELQTQIKEMFNKFLPLRK